ncbi:MAG: hypothetical protein R3E69_01360 [Steroidobacteraceae bacterium]
MFNANDDTPATHRGGSAHSRPAPAAFWRYRAAAAAAVLAFTFWALGTGRALAQTPPGTVIRNVAAVQFVDGSGVPGRVLTNAADLTVVPAPSRATLTLLRSTPRGTSGSTAPTQCVGSGGTVTLPPPVLADGTTVDPSQPLPLSAAPIVHGGEALFLRLRDTDQNLDATVIDTVEIEVTAAGGDRERLVLRESGANTGEFVGYIQTRAAAVTAGDCVLQVERDATLASAYADRSDASDTASAQALVDPFGLVFDSRTGAPVNGARIRLVTASGAPAQVLGDDGVSAYPAEMVTGQPVTDAGGTVYNFAPGVFRFPLIATGDYRLEVVPPIGHAFPSRATEAELQALPGAPFAIGPASFGNSFTLSDPAPTNIDVPLDPSGSALFLQKGTITTVAAAGDFVQYTLTVQNVGTSGRFSGVTITDRLPAGVRYRPGSTRSSTARLPDPAVSADGGTLTFTIGTLDPGAALSLRYVVEITVGARGPTLTNSAEASSDTGITSNAAQAVIQLREELFRERAIVMGRVVAGDCEHGAHELTGAAGVRVYLEDGRYAITDEDGKYHFEDVRPGTHVVQLDTVTLPAGYRPATCGDRVRHAGRGASQFVDVRGGALWRTDFVLAAEAGATPLAGRPAPGTLAVALPKDARTTRDALAEQGARTPAPQPRDRATLEGMPDFTLERLAPGIAWLWPGPDFSAPIPSLKVTIAHGPKDRVELRLNGVAVSALNFDGTTTNNAKTVAVSHWRGIDLRDGDNTLTATVRGPEGALLQELTRVVHYAGGAVRAEVVSERSTLIADGRTHPVVALRLFDAYGKPARRGTRGRWRVDAPYRTWWEVASQRDNPLVAVGEREPTFEVGDDGIALLELEPTAQTGNALLRLRLNDRQSLELRAWLAPEARDWILVGLAEGSGAWRTISGNAEAAAAADLDEDYSENGRVAFFAKGRIKGEFLLTLAYDSARDPELAKRRLLGVIEPNRYYTLYGDAADPREEAASAKKLYVKLERRQFMALFGDFETGLTVTELTRYSRSFTGLRSDFVGRHVGYTAFAADSALGFVKDELRGDGTSGLYRLTRSGLVVGSDKLRIEIRDRFRSEQVIETRPLNRFVDYSIDYYAGTLFFKEPVPARDAQFNPVYIIVEYEVNGDGEEHVTAGGRGHVRFADDRVEVGATFVDEGAPQGDSQLYGSDLRWRLGEATEWRAELAHSESDDPTRAARADAWLTELKHVSERLDARLYAGETEPGFGTGQQLSSEVGIRKAGLDARLKWGEHWQGLGEFFTEKALETGADRRHASLELRREADLGRIGVGLRRVEDSGTIGGARESEQAFVTASRDFFDRRVTLRGGADANLGGGAAASADYPDRFLLGADYALRDDIKLFAEYEHADGAAFDADMARVGVRATPWNRAQLTSGLTQQATEYGPRTFANFGLTQGWQVNERLGLDVGLDSSNTVRGTTLAPLVPGRPLASGTLSDDYLASFAGALYRTELWTATSRIEWRASDTEDRAILSGGLYREPVRGHALAFTLRAMHSDFTSGVDTAAADAQFAWAFRPVESRWIVLDRLDLRFESQDEPTGKVEAARIIHNVNANWQLDPRTQLGVQWGVRYVRSSFDGERYDGLSDLYGLDLRRDLDARFDVGLHGTALNSWESGVHDFALGIDLGVTVARGLWISIGYNVQGFEDDDYGASRYTAKGPFLKLRLKADQDTFKDLPWRRRP